MDMTPTLIPKSNQLNADDLIAGPRTITITKVSAGNNEQPVAVYFEGDNGRPWYPSKGMRRVLVAAWGAESSQYVGRSATLFRNPEVTYGGIQVGGIQISHLSNLDNPLSIALTISKQKRSPYKVQPLQLAAPVDPVKQAADACVTAGLTFEGITAFCQMVSEGQASALAQLPRETLDLIIQRGISAETVAKCNPAAAPDPDDLPAAFRSA